MPFDPFVIPFSVGFIFVLAVMGYKYISWIRQMPKPQAPLKGFNRLKAIWDATVEVFMESLLHRKIFKQNVMLGFMHSSIAFGWFLLIVLGHFEAKAVSDNAFNPPYFSVFLYYFVPERSMYKGHALFTFGMEFILALILSGVFLAYLKRLTKRLFGMKRTSKMRGIDKIALYSLWSIFPLRLIAESFNAYVHGSGGFLTEPVGQFFAKFLPVAQLEYPMWWAYSLSLGVFFIALPWSRYSHIPTEMVLIYLRRLGYRSCSKPTGYTMFDLYSCSRCGICIDSCQMNIVYRGRNETVTAHYIYDVRAGHENDFALFSCLACGRCEDACPVGVKTVDLRIGNRYENTKEFGLNHKIQATNGVTNSNIGYFSGCMGKLTPTVIDSMKTISNAAGDTLFHIDEEKGICCGRPLLLAGQLKQSEKIIEKNKQRIESLGIKTLVTSCPICLRTFKNDYNLKIEVIHHSEYIERLIANKKLVVNNSKSVVAYHDPCDLAHGLGIRQAPRNVINSAAVLYENPDSKSHGLCCGGGLAGVSLNSQQKLSIAYDAIQQIINGKTNMLVTSCPLCKKTFAQTRMADVKDIAELVAENILTDGKGIQKSQKQSVLEAVSG